MTNNQYPLLTVSNLSISFDTELIRNAEFDVHKGEIVLIQGPNGSGKSSILKTLIGELKNDNVMMEYDNHPLVFTKFREDISYLEQDEDIFLAKTPYEIAKIYKDIKEPHIFSVKKLFTYIGSIFKKDEPLDQDIVDLFTYFDCLDIMNKNINKECSGGEKRMASIIACFAREADLYILDEPINKLDRRRAKKIGLYIEQLRKKNKAVLLITHCRMYLNATKAYIIDQRSIKHLPNVPKACGYRSDDDIINMDQ